MREIGVSVYPDFYSVDNIKNYLKKARDLGFSKVFVSLILNNLGFENARKPDKDSWREVFNYCKEIGLEASADINDKVFENFGCSMDNLKPLFDMGISKIRLDAGFSKDQLATLTKNRLGIKIEINASFSSGNEDGEVYYRVKEFLEYMNKCGNIHNLTACHNFFPLVGTGLSLEDLRGVNSLFKEYGILIGGFVASQLSPKDLHQNGHGVCTIEAHRYLPPHFAMMELFASGFDYVLTGDSVADDAELSEMSEYAKDDCIAIPVVFNKYINNEVKNKILSMELVSRTDQPAQLIRATATRGMEVLPCYCAPRDKFTVSVNNKNSSHYMGEIQIALCDMGGSIEHNVVGFIHPFGIRLLKFIKSGLNKFKFIEY